MKQIERLPAVVLCATLALPCLTPAPEKFGRAGRVPPGGWMQSKPGERSRPGVPPAVRSSARRVASSSFERNPRSAT